MRIDTRKLKKVLIKAIPYTIFSYVGNILGYAYQTAEGDGIQEKLLPFINNIGTTFARVFPVCTRLTSFLELQSQASCGL